MKKANIKSYVFFICYGAMFLMCGKQNEIQAENLSQVSEKLLEVVFNGDKIEGIFSGQLLDGLPEGEGTFEVEKENAQGIKSITGVFSAGELNGSVTVSFMDDRVAKGKCKKGKLQGTIILSLDEDTYQRITYSAGKPVGRTRTYYKDEIVSQDWYYDGELLSDLVDEAVHYNPEDYYLENYEYYDDVVQVRGEVLAVGIENDQCVIKLVDSDGQKYYAVYSNGAYVKESPTIVPAVEVGDTISVYGYFNGVIQNNYTFDAEDYGFSFPEVKIFYGEIENSSFNVFSSPQKNYSYDEILANPYYYAGDKITVKGIVENFYISYDKAKVYYKIRTDKGEIYYAVESLDEFEKDELPLTGDSVKIKGKLNGNYRQYSIKMNGTKVADCYPYILSSSFSLE